MIDTHTHLNSEEFSADLPDVLLRARAAGVTAMVVPSIDHASFARSVALLKERDVYCAIGIHPHHAMEFSSDVEEEIRSLARENKKVVAVGEIGLDYHYDFAPHDVQQHAFRTQLRIARETGKPAIVHNRESDEDLLSIIAEEQDGSLRFQLHCFSSTEEVLRHALDLGGVISFTGNITFAKSTLAAIVLQTPLDRMMIETDAPYLAPVPLRGKRNEPSYVKLVAEKIALIKNISLSDVITHTTNTARQFFALACFIFAIAYSAHAQTSDSVTAAMLSDPTAIRYADLVPSVYVGAFGGSHNLGLEIQRQVDARTAQFAYGLEIGGRLTQRLEIQLLSRWQNTVVTKFPGKYPNDVNHDSTFKYLPPNTAAFLSEEMQARSFAANLRYIVNPRARIQFHIVLGAEQFNFLIRQQDAFVLDTTGDNRNNHTSAVREQAHQQYAIALGLGLRLPLAMERWYVTPYMQLSIGLAFNANTQVSSKFNLRPDHEALTTTAAVFGVMISPPLFR